MGFKKTKDLAVVTGSYMKDGASKNRYQNVGYILEDEKGAKMIMLNRSFNPAGVPFKEGSDTIIVNQFDVKDKAAPAHQAAPAPTDYDANDPNSDIPF